ncbi:MAG TPA: hypothetical protein VGR49_02050 [Actinomycetota bacterium]|jgi:hypothetical protein|nr:hypothetical protein [Actinomycetota bacterium]
MDADQVGTNASRINRREALKRTAIATGVAWTAPIIMSVRTPAFAQYGSCEEGCAYIAHFDLPSFACSPCQDVCLGDCADYGQPHCAGAACARITSVTCSGVEDNILRVCTDCQLSPVSNPFLIYCFASETDCTCGLGGVDPNDPRCALFGLFSGGCQGNRVNVSFSCSAC